MAPAQGWHAKSWSVPNFFEKLAKFHRKNFENRVPAIIWAASSWTWCSSFWPRQRTISEKQGGGHKTEDDCSIFARALFGLWSEISSSFSSYLAARTNNWPRAGIMCSLCLPWRLNCSRRASLIWVKTSRKCFSTFFKAGKQAHTINCTIIILAFYL